MVTSHFRAEISAWKPGMRLQTLFRLSTFDVLRDAVGNFQVDLEVYKISTLKRKGCWLVAVTALLINTN